MLVDTAADKSGGCPHISGRGHGGAFADKLLWPPLTFKVVVYHDRSDDDIANKLAERVLRLLRARESAPSLSGKQCVKSPSAPRPALNLLLRVLIGLGIGVGVAVLQPAEILDRTVPRRWEEDLIIGRSAHSQIGALVERTTQFAILLRLPEHYDVTTVADQIRSHKCASCPSAFVAQSPGTMQKKRQTSPRER